MKDKFEDKLKQLRLFAVPVHSLVRRWALLGGFLLLIALIPLVTRAGFSLLAVFGEKSENYQQVSYNSQTVPILAAALSPDPKNSRGGAEVAILDNKALLAESGPRGTFADVEESAYSSDQISLHVVREGETLSEIADMYRVEVNTIRWANDINSGGKINPGQTLLILPIDGVKYTVRKGDTLSIIAKKTGGDVDEIARYNGLKTDSVLAVGDEVVVPDGEFSHSTSNRGRSRSSSSKFNSQGTRSYSPGYYIAPIDRRLGRKSQGFHGPYQAVDFAAPVGTSIRAMADGVVIAARSPKRWNGGFGGLVILKHDNNTQTLYAHNSKNLVTVGQQVSQGQTIAQVGSTGRSTGPHVHFEVRGIGKPVKTPIFY